MNATDISAHIRREPFQPFKIKLRGGKTLRVPARGWCLVTEKQLWVSVPKRPGGRLPDRIVPVAPDDVVSLQPVHVRSRS
mgnify:CR=1 FL=1